MSEHLWTVNVLKGPKDCLNFHSSIFVIFLVTLKRITSKNSVLVVPENLRLFVYKLTTDDKHSLSVKESA